MERGKGLELGGKRRRKVTIFVQVKVPFPDENVCKSFVDQRDEKSIETE